jgi:hypothetical protein
MFACHTCGRVVERGRFVKREVPVARFDNWLGFRSAVCQERPICLDCEAKEMRRRRGVAAVVLLVFFLSASIFAWQLL